MARGARLSRIRPIRAAAIAAALLVPSVAAIAPARATFHLNEITKVMVGWNGDSTIQAVEFKMLASGENLVTGGVIRTYNASGTLLGTLGTFASSLPNGILGRNILCATSGFASTFGITPDLLIAPGIPVTTGQVSFELSTCLVNAVAYGGVTTPKNGSTSAAPIPSGGATVLARRVDDVTFPNTCPLAEDASARFVLTSGSSLAPVTFRNNAGATANVFTTATAVEGDLRTRVPRVRVYPNPALSRATIEAEGASLGLVTLYDIRGTLLRRWQPGSPTGTGGVRILWDTTDASGRRLPSGIYFIRFGSGKTAPRVPLVLLR